jgi:Na+/proline symporter
MATPTSVALAVLHASHIAAWAFAYGAITYTYYRLNAQMETFAGDGYEAFADATAAGLHRWILGALVVAALSGAASVAVAPPLVRTTWWWLIVGAKAAILGLLLLVQAHVAMRMWPRRRRAPRRQWQAERRHFFRAALLTSFLLLCQLALGSLAQVVGDGSR